MKKITQNKKPIDKFISIVKSLFGNNPKEFRVVVLSIFGATTFWFLNSLNKNYTTSFHYPVNYIYNKEKFIPINKLPNKIEVKVNGQGWDLFISFFSTKQRPFNFELENKIQHTVISDWEIEKNFNEVHRKISLVQVLKNEIIIDLDEKISKKITFYLDSISLDEKIIQIDTALITPKSIEITGPKSALNKMSDSLPIYIKDIINEDFDEDIKTNALIVSKNLIIKEKSINVKINTSKLITKELIADVTLNTNDSTSISNLYKARIQCQIPEEKEEDINFENFIILADLKSKNDATAKLQLTAIPNYVFNVYLLDTIINLESKVQ